MTSTSRRTTTVPVTTMEEVPVLSAHEREELLGVLEEASADLSAGKGIDYDPQEFRDRLAKVYRAAKR